jgi:hypothetical protein
MSIDIAETPLRIELAGNRGKVTGRRYGEVGKRLMDPMWAEIRAKGIKTTGINHWVYLAEDEMFTGVELASPAGDRGSLEPLSVELRRYARTVHRGPYTELGVAWDRLCAELAARGEKKGFPGIEIYGHWNEDPCQLVTTILVALAPQGAKVDEGV